MRRCSRAALAFLVAALAAPAAPAQADAPSGCTVSDPRIDEASGLVVTADGYRIVNDGGDQVLIYRLDAECAVSATTTATVDPYDIEDLALGPDGTLWLADIGDNNTRRDSVAVIVVPDQPGNVTPVLRRLTYPDGPHDAESMIVDDSGRAIIMTKTLVGLVGIYRSEPLDLSSAATADPQPLHKVGEIRLTSTNTAGGPVAAPLSNLMSTGAARCGDVTALRSYTDVYLWRGDDPAAAIIDTEPTIMAIGPQRQGESIAFSPDCTTGYLHGEGVGVAIDTFAVPAAPTSATASSAATTRDVAQAERQRWRVVALGGAGAVVATIAVVIARRRRHRG